MNIIKSYFIHNTSKTIGILVLSSLIALVVYVAYTTDLAALFLLTILLVIMASSGISHKPPPAEIAECAASFIERAANDLREKLPVFAHLYYTVFTANDGSKHLYPRWEWRQTDVSGLRILQVGCLFTGKKQLSEEELHDSLVVLQGLLADDGKRGLLGLPLFPTYADGFPALHLLDIHHQGSCLVFFFVYVDGEKTARKVHEYGLPRLSGDSDDQDF